MGKNLKGKECGKGICQRKDGQYYARFVNKCGKRQDNYFPTLPEARNWPEDARYADKHDNVFTPSDMTMDPWFEYWIENVVGDLAPSTRRNYRERYIHNIQPVIGSRLLTDVKPMHCKIHKTLEYRHKQGCRLAGPPKTKQSYRTIPLNVPMRYLSRFHLVDVAGKSQRRSHKGWSTLTCAPARKNLS